MLKRAVGGAGERVVEDAEGQVPSVAERPGAPWETPRGRVMGDARVRVPLLGEWDGAPREAPELRVAEETPGFRPWRRARCSARTPPWLT